MVLFGGVEVVQEVVRLGLADEYWIKLYPTALGAGRPMVTGGPLDLTLVESRTYDSGIVTLRYLEGWTGGPMPVKVKSYLSPADPTLAGQWPYLSSYAANGQVFIGSPTLAAIKIAITCASLCRMS